MGDVEKVTVISKRGGSGTVVKGNNPSHALTNYSTVLCFPSEGVALMHDHRMLTFAILVLVSVPRRVVGQDSNEQQVRQAATASIADPDVTPPHVVHASNPKYPRDARAAGHQGTSILSFTVGTDGNPRDINVVRKLDTELDDCAIAAVRKWRYEPARKGDKPLEVKIETRIQFRLHGGSNGKIAELWDRADKGDPKADWALWKAYREGDGVSQDEQLGLRFLKRAADWNLPEAQFQMGDYFYRDQRPPDYVKAYMWHALSKRAGGKQGEGMLKILGPEMSPEQLSEADTRVDYWPEAPPKDPQ